MTVSHPRGCDTLLSRLRYTAIAAPFCVSQHYLLTFGAKVSYPHGVVNELIGSHARDAQLLEGKMAEKQPEVAGGTGINPHHVKTTMEVKPGEIVYYSVGAQGPSYGGGCGGGGSCSTLRIWNLEIDDTWEMVRDPEGRETFTSPPITPPSCVDKVIIKIWRVRK